MWAALSAIASILGIAWGIWKFWFSEQAKFRREQKERDEATQKAREDQIKHSQDVTKEINKSIKLQDESRDKFKFD